MGMHLLSFRCLGPVAALLCGACVGGEEPTMAEVESAEMYGTVTADARRRDSLAFPPLSTDGLGSVYQ